VLSITSLLQYFFFVNYNRSSTTKAYQSSDKEDQVEKFSRCSMRTIAVAGKWVTCLVQWCVIETKVTRTQEKRVTYKHSRDKSYMQALKR
jgi:hypothetical protein